MIRRSIRPRTHWVRTVEQLGFYYHTLGGTYWDESVQYEFSQDEAVTIEAATTELHKLCLAAVEYTIRNDRFSSLCIREEDRPLIISSWENEEPSLYGRFDLRYDGTSAPKLYEYNADTPTSILEAGIVQRQWAAQLHPMQNQMSRIDELLVAAWRRMNLSGELVHFSCVGDSAEDRGNVAYLAAAAERAGIETAFLPVEEVAYDPGSRRFIDKMGRPIATWFKLYPWEWLLKEKFGEHVRAGRMRLIEPAWKMILSNKAILPLLWELFPEHPNLLASYWTPDKLGSTYVRKPLFGREGSNISIQMEGRTEYVPGPFAREPVIFQEFAPLPEFDGRFALIGSWVIGDRAAGIGVRESARLISENLSRFVPHVVLTDGSLERVDSAYLEVAAA